MQNREKRGIEKNVLYGLQKFDCYYECPKGDGKEQCENKNLQISITVCIKRYHVKIRISFVTKSSSTVSSIGLCQLMYIRHSCRIVSFEL